MANLRDDEVEEIADALWNMRGRKGDRWSCEELVRDVLRAMSPTVRKADSARDLFA